MTFSDIQQKSLCFIMLLILAVVLTLISVHHEPKDKNLVKDKSVDEAHTMRNAEEKGVGVFSASVSEILQFRGTSGIGRSTHIFVSITGLFFQDEINECWHYHALGGGEQDGRPKQTVATGKKQTHTENESAEKEKLPPQAPAASDKSALVEKTEEWDWSVCPAAFGCPCPMMP